MNKKGFTLVEIIAIVAILAILVIIAAPNVMKLFREGKEKTMVIQENEVLDAAKLYLEDYCRNPISSNYLQECNDNKYELFLFGDVNNDSNVDNLDLIKLRKHVNNDGNIDAAIIERGDLNVDGKVDDNDLQIIREYLAGATDINLEKTYVCLKTIKEKGYLKDDVLYSGSIECNGFVAFTKENKTYSNGKTYLYCGNGDYKTVDYNNSNYNKYLDAINKCKNMQTNNTPTEPDPTPSPTPDPETIKNGWELINSRNPVEDQQWVYYDNNVKIVGLHKLQYNENKYYYYFDNNGIMKIGWVYYDNGYHLFSPVDFDGNGSLDGRRIQYKNTSSRLEISFNDNLTKKYYLDNSGTCYKSLSGSDKCDSSYIGTDKITKINLNVRTDYYCNGDECYTD